MGAPGQTAVPLRGEADRAARRTRAKAPAVAARRRSAGIRRLGSLAEFAGRALGETLYTTRCIICDAPGGNLCSRCRMRLPYIDRYLACERCGAPFGRLQCTECNTFSLAEVGRDGLPFQGCASVVEHRGRTRLIATGYKDAGQRELGYLMAQMMGDALPSRWLQGGPLLTYVPADRRSRRIRGFDHMQLLCRHLSGLLGLETGCLLSKEPARDQRGLSRPERFRNMAGRIHLAEGASVPRAVLLVDDVLTTGATLYAACDALREGGALRIHCATFARTM